MTEEESVAGSRSAADVLLYAPNGELQDAVEVKAVADRPDGWAVRLLSNLLEFGLVPERVPYFLLATPDAFYLRGDDRDRPLGGRPDGACGPAARPNPTGAPTSRGCSLPTWGVPPSRSPTWARRD